jgi:hypothetical protein
MSNCNLPLSSPEQPASSKKPAEQPSSLSGTSKALGVVMMTLALATGCSKNTPQDETGETKTPTAPTSARENPGQSSSTTSRSDENKTPNPENPAPPVSDPTPVVVSEPAENLVAEEDQMAKMEKQDSANIADIDERIHAQFQVCHDCESYKLATERQKFQQVLGEEIPKLGAYIESPLSTDRVRLEASATLHKWARATKGIAGQMTAYYAQKYNLNQVKQNFITANTALGSVQPPHAHEPAPKQETEAPTNLEYNPVPPNPSLPELKDRIKALENERAQRLQEMKNLNDEARNAWKRAADQCGNRPRRKN